MIFPQPHTKCCCCLNLTLRTLCCVHPPSTRPPPSESCMVYKCVASFAHTNRIQAEIKFFYYNIIGKIMKYYMNIMLEVDMYYNTSPRTCNLWVSIIKGNWFNWVEVKSFVCEWTSSTCQSCWCFLYSVTNRLCEQLKIKSESYPRPDPLSSSISITVLHFHLLCHFLSCFFRPLFSLCLISVIQSRQRPHLVFFFTVSSHPSPLVIDRDLISFLSSLSEASVRRQRTPPQK